MRDEALHLLQENDERHHTFRDREAEVGEVGFLYGQVPVHSRCRDMDSPLQMMQAHQQLQAQVMQLSSRQNEIAHQLRAVLDKFPQEPVARPISVPANRPSPRYGLCFFCRQKGHFIRDFPRKRESSHTQSHKNSCDAEKRVTKLQEENDHLKETLEEMNDSRASDLNKRETQWKREIHQLTSDLQRASCDILRRSRTQRAADDIKGQVSRGNHEDRTGRGGVGHMQTHPGEMLRQSRAESGGDEVSAIATDGTRKQVPGHGAETGDGTCCKSSTSV